MPTIRVTIVIARHQRMVQGLTDAFTVLTNADA